MTDATLILASASPRRLELLQQLGLDPEVCPADIDEMVHEGEHASDYVMRMAREKAQAVAQQYPANNVIVGSDTSVVVDDQVLGKPEDQEHAAQMLEMLSGRSHQVMSAVTVISSQGEQTLLSDTRVDFRSIGQDEMAAYWNTGEPLGKAGGYAIQGLGAGFIETIEGSYSGVMGLPLFETAQLLQRAGITVLSKET